MSWNRVRWFPEVVTVQLPNSELLFGQNDARVNLGDLQNLRLLIQAVGQMCVSYRELSLATNPLIFGSAAKQYSTVSDGFAVENKYMSGVFSFLILYHIKRDVVQHK